jgi:hypothetical protein
MARPIPRDAPAITRLLLLQCAIRGHFAHLGPDYGRYAYYYNE